MDLDETLVAQEFATSSVRRDKCPSHSREESSILTCAVIVCIEHGKQSADGKEIGVVGENHLDDTLTRASTGLDSQQWRRYSAFERYITARKSN
jgi:hypothetical protein